MIDATLPNGKPKYPELAMPKSPVTPWGSDSRYHEDGEGQTNIFPDPKTSPVPPPPEGKARIFIGIPMLDIKYEFFESFLKFWTQLLLAQDERYEVGYHIAYRKPVHMAEEYLTEIAMYNKATHLLLMDDDIYDITKEDLDKLLEADKDVVGGIMHASKFPYAMCAFRRYEPEKKVCDMPIDDSMYRLYEIPCLCESCQLPQSHWDGKFCPACGAEQHNLIQRADLIPFAFTLIKMSVFDKIKYPWFHCTNRYPTDSWFADRLIAAGLEEYAHMGVRLNHAGITDATKPHFVAMGMERARRGNSVIALSPEQMEAHQKLLLDKMRETEAAIRERPVVACAGKAVANADGMKQGITMITHGT